MIIFFIHTFLNAHEKINNFSYYVDTDSSKNINEMIFFKNWKKTENITFAYTNNVYWIKFNIHMKQNENLKYFLLSNNHKIEEIDLFFIKDEKIISYYKSGFNNPSRNKEFFNRKDFFLIPNIENIDVLIKVRNNLFPLNLDFEILSNYSLETVTYIDNFMLSIYFILLISLFIMHFIIYKTTNLYLYKHFLIYLSLVIIVGLYNFGLINKYFFENGMNDFIIVVFKLISYFIILYFYVIFNHLLNLKKNHKKFNTILISILIILFFTLLISDIFAINNYQLLFLIYFKDLCLLTLFLFIFFILIFKSFERSFISKLLILAWIPLFIIIIIYIFNNLFFILNIDIVEFIISILFIFEFIFISLIIAYKYNLKEKEKKQTLIKSKDKEILYLRQSKLIKMGEMLNNIAHQWKQPLARINSIVFKSYDLLEEDKKEELKKQLCLIENETSNMSNTISSLLSFFHINKKEELFNLYDLAMNQKGFVKNYNTSIDFEINCSDKTIETTGFRYEYEQVIRVLLENAFDSFKNSNISSYKIIIFIEKKNNIPIFSVENSGNKIEGKIMKKIFEPYFTTKDKNKHQGIGLYISKMLIEESMNKKLCVENTILGVKFTIKG